MEPVGPQCQLKAGPLACAGRIEFFLLLIYLNLDVGPRFDTSYFDVAIQEVAKFNVLLIFFLFFGKGLSHIFEIEA